MSELLDQDWLRNAQSQSELSSDTQLNISANLCAFSKTTAF